MKANNDLVLTHIYCLSILLQGSLYKKLQKQETNMKLSLFLLKFLVSLDWWKCENILHKMEKKICYFLGILLLTLPNFWVFQSSLPGQTNRWLLRRIADSTHRDTETDEPKESQWEVILRLCWLFLLHKSLLLQLCPSHKHSVPCPCIQQPPRALPTQRRMVWARGNRLLAGTGSIRLLFYLGMCSVVSWGSGPLCSSRHKSGDEKMTRHRNFFSVWTERMWGLYCALPAWRKLL